MSIDDPVFGQGSTDQFSDGWEKVAEVDQGFGAYALLYGALPIGDKWDVRALVG